MKAPLRVRVAVGRSACELHAVRWETLRDPQDRAYPLTGPDLFLSRYLSSRNPRTILPQATGQDPRSIVIVANPKNVSRYKVGKRQRALWEINVDEEVERAKIGLGGTDIVAVLKQGQCQPDRISHSIEEAKCDFVYLVCHGERVQGQTKLYLEDESGDTAVINGDWLVTQFYNLKHVPRMVVLVSCQSGSGELESTGKDEGRMATGSDQAADRGSGELVNTSKDEGALAALGPRLAIDGVPAVLAMQGNVSMETAHCFIKKFFEDLLTNGGFVDEAASTARASAAVKDRPDAWMPVLFMRLRTGQVLYGPGLDKEFGAWESLAEHLTKRTCVPILGPGVVEPLVGSHETVARRWADSFDLPVDPQCGGDLPRVAQYLALRHDTDYPKSQLMDYLKLRGLGGLRRGRARGARRQVTRRAVAGSGEAAG